MREIKFRAWDKKEKAMVYDVIVKGIWKSKIDPFTWFVEVIKDFDEFDEPIYFNPYDVEIMQYTGLKDKNNTEIYEGDLVEFVDLEGLYEIIFEKDYSRFACKNIKNKKTLPLFYGRVKKVVGNIYENQELIEE